MEKAFSFRQAETLKKIFKKHHVKYLFIGKSGAILLGYSDTTQDADVFVKKDPDNTSRLVSALRELRFKLNPAIAKDVLQGKDFIQLRNGPFDMDLVFAPDGIENFEEAWKRHIDVQGFPVCHLDDIIHSKEKANRVKDRESLPRLKAFRDYWKKR
ncbi:MAG: hypothetical protein A2W61_01565 [Deltaproteobacteria bacterium RIFCSPLOWO2_01_44_7]|nr:MAG: hypothetical protein A2712_10525 [Deltaproteobacteria bacterium RIFCSPHIGHO2_01_FULL_43_49]OGQ15542.1 MAG: hypothetical protein A3D22_11055 [Deltaproteobacteria bacterium RIFCSPHIGHO2_02_FULL_44_53]OGQ28484.1 MAG: hypothetical protein A3D98_03240 [Deltaproteobacteria bacterium RIFCSPHIGHO2_12_FULL_44_21]OGQ32348.1 MAG: hypothetical protein A2979_00900 [Deltaproteobacteria bacterium RIFCSPLOWO2_01_FULL_45_74]OGQ42538.1 MAG: hypothetical protein A2W61_01565 [Deltaproteobacteria bacterium 